MSEENIAKVSIVGVGMKNNAGVAARMFEAMAAENINILMISTSEIKISCVIEDKYGELAVRVLHDAFGLEHPPTEEKVSISLNLPPFSKGGSGGINQRLLIPLNPPLRKGDFKQPIRGNPCAR